jgi:voltage-gated potassium channel
MSEPRTAGQQRAADKEALEGERHELLARVTHGLEKPMVVLGFVWLVLLVIDFTSGLSPFLTRISYVIWALFVLDFLLEFTIAPRKREYLRQNWLTAVALVVPALRVLSAFRLLRALRAARGLRLVRVVSRVNRGMRSLGRVMGRRGFGYVVALTLLVDVAGAAGMYAFEHDVTGSTINGFGSALWWTAMVLTTMGSDYFPRSPEGRLLCLLLAVYGFAVFGYVTATVASFFVARDAEEDEGEIAGAAQLERLRQEIAALREEIRATRT